MKFTRAAMAALTICGLSLGIFAWMPATSVAIDGDAAEPASPALVERAAEGPAQGDSTATLGVVEELATSDDPAASEPAADEPATEEPEVPTPVTFLDENCGEVSAEGCEPLTAQATTLRSGWYILEEDITFNHVLTIEGDVRLVLAGKHTLTANDGIQVRKDATLSLYGEKDAPGRILVRRGIARHLTAEEQAEWDALVAAQEAAGEPAPQDAQLLFVWPCVDVTAGDREPWPKDAPEPDPEPERAPRHVSKPTLDAGLLGKDYLIIRPRTSHTMRKEGEYLLVEDGHFTCTACDGWFEDAEGTMRIQKPAPVEEANVQADAAREVTITFEPNGGSGSMESLTVMSGEGFVLPECTFTPPEGMVFNSWSLGMAGSTVSVPTDTTVRAWWKKAPEVQPDTPDSGGGTDTDGSTTPVNQDGPTTPSTQTDEEGPATGTTSTGTSAKKDAASPDTSDASIALGEAAAVMMVAGCMALLVGEYERLR